MKSLKSVYKFVAVILAMLMLSSVFTFPAPADAAGGSETVVNWGGGRSYRLFVPSGYIPGQPIPLVVMMHGCTQTAVQFRDGTQMNQIAEQENFIVMYPEQPTSANQNRCWNWFETAHQRRGSGEPQIIVDMVRQVQANFTIDHSAVFVGGLSAGGAMSSTLGLLYPDVFAATSINAGLGFQAGTSMLNAFTAMSPGTPAIAPATAAGNAFNQVPANARGLVPSIVLHGEADFTVRPLAGEHVVTQMLAFNARTDASISAASRTTRTGSANSLNYTLHSFTNGVGDIVVQHYVIAGLGHSWSGGNGAIAHTDSRGPNASYLSWRFFQNAAGLGDEECPIPPTEPPTQPTVPPTDPTVPPTDPTVPPTDPTVPPTDPTVPPTDPTVPPVEFIYVRANVNQHNMAGRVSAAQFFHYFSLHGPTGLFNMYQVVGTNTWTSTRPTN